jgi:hypothetical protein
MSEDVRIKKQVLVERLHELFVLDHLTGQLFWKSRPGSRLNARFAGKVAGYLSNLGYVQIRVDGRLYMAHLIVRAMVKGEWPVDEVDHRNGIRNDNTPDNLRDAERFEQGQNLSLRSDSTSGYTGVWFDKSRNLWVAMIAVKRKRFWLGRFDTPEEARNAYRQAKEKLHLFQPTVREA